MVKALVVYDSVYGNTEKVAKALAAGLERGMVEVGIVKAGAVKFDDLDAVDLLCVGGPVHAWSASKPVKEFLERLKSVKGLSGKKAFAFDTKLSEGRLAGSAGGKIERELKGLGLIIAKPSESAIVYTAIEAADFNEKMRDRGVPKTVVLHFVRIEVIVGADLIHLPIGEPYPYSDHTFAFSNKFQNHHIMLFLRSLLFSLISGLGSISIGSGVITPAS